MDPGANEAPTWLVRTSGHDRHPAVSPNGSWLAFTTEENGQAEVFVQPGGVSPLWAPDGRRLYWRRGDDVVSVDLDAAGAAQGAPVIRAVNVVLNLDVEIARLISEAEAKR